MSFISVAFLVFFPLVSAVYFAIPHSWRWLHLLVSSCVFYMFFIPAYIFILAFTIVVDYFAGIAIGSAEGATRKRYLVVSLIANIGVLAVFKYANFAIENLNALLAMTGVATEVPRWSLILPIGLSFHTFQAMSYTIEVYRGNQEPERHFGIYALYVMFYPQLVAGPIERPQSLLHQFRELHHFDYNEVTRGLRQMAWGFFKKTVIADRLVVGVDTVYSDPRQYSGIQLIAATVLFAVQVYADFSGYSDIAIGAARVIGFRLMKNFERPYGAANISEFWRRWHISLYSWLNDYLYSAIVVAVRDWGRWAMVFAVMVTFSVSGLWHGAAWKFVIFGAMHGGAMTVELLTRRWRSRHMKGPGWGYGGVALTFAFVCFTFIFFRANDVSDAVWIVRHLGRGAGTLVGTLGGPAALDQTLGALGFYRQELVIAGLAVAFMFGVEALARRMDLSRTLARWPRPVRWSAYYAVLAAIVFLGAHNATQPFVYFQF